ncbi:hypothetical protein H0H93_003517 [Arthromyces matolae]|nr:hypothetical protein H0H93_003517 [Arthromyces matolae]
MRSFIYFILSSILGGKQEPLRHIVAYLQRHGFDEKEPMNYDDEPLVARFMSRASQPDEPLEGIAMRLMNINFGSIHTSSIFITQALFELSLLTKSELDCIREEILRALEAEGGWTKVALLNFKKLDSVLREVGRYYGLMHFALPRIAIQGHDLHDGTRIPPGFRVAIDMKALRQSNEGSISNIYDPSIFPSVLNIRIEKASTHVPVASLQP